MGTRKELREERREKVLALMKEYEGYRTELSEYVPDLPKYLRYTRRERIATLLAIACGLLIGAALTAKNSPIVCVVLGMVIGLAQFLAFAKDRDGKYLPFSDRRAIKRLEKIISGVVRQLEWIDGEWSMNSIYDQYDELARFIKDEELGQARFLLSDYPKNPALRLKVRLDGDLESQFYSPTSRMHEELRRKVASKWYQAYCLNDEEKVLREFDTRLHAGI